LKRDTVRLFVLCFLESLKNGVVGQDSVPSPAQVRAEVEKILVSKSFAGSETVRNLLRYLADRTVASPDAHPKELDIATTLLGRSGSAFDPKLDPVVRVQTTRLRGKLAEYYVSEGLEDRVYIEIPKGSYMVTAAWRGGGSAVDEVVAEGLASASAPLLEREGVGRRWPLVGAVAALVLASLGVWWWVALRPRPDDALRGFWQPFASAGAETLVVYSNPKLVGSSTTGMRIFDPARDSGAIINGGYSGAGEVMAMYSITNVIARMGGNLRPRRSQLFTWEDAKAHRLIFVGAPPHNVPLGELPVARRFRLKPWGAEPMPGAGCVENLRPTAGELGLYCQEGQGQSQVEYIVVTSSGGVDDRQAALLFAGTTTFGTEAGVEYFCDPGKMAELAKALGVTGRSGWPAFEALLRCHLRGGIPVSAELVKVSR